MTVQYRRCYYSGQPQERRFRINLNFADGSHWDRPSMHLILPDDREGSY